MVGGASYGRAVPVTEHMSEAVWQRQLAEVKVPKDPPVPVTVKSSHPGATRGGLLYGWSKDWHHGQWMGLCWFEREYAPGFWVAGGHWPNAGAVLLVQTAQTVGLVSALSDALGPWRRPTALHDPGKVLLDLAVSLAVGGDCLADVAQLRGAPEVFGLVASDPTVTRLIDALAADAPAALAADLVAWMQTLALTGTAARRWEPKRLRLRLLSIPARHARTGRRRLLHLAATAPFTALVLQVLAALDRLAIRPATPAPG